MRLLRGLLRRKNHRTKSLSEQDRIFKHIWHHVTSTGDPKYPPQRTQQNVLILQMGKVASLSLKSAINQQGRNGFHCHSISAARQARSLQGILGAEPTVHLAGHFYRQVAHQAALHMMVGWYRRNKQRNGSRLKVVTLTRDPVSWLQSSYVQKLDRQLPAIRDWRRSRGLPTGTEQDDLAATADFFQELGPLVAASHPSSDLAAAVALGERLVAEKAPHQALFARHFRQCLLPLGWFDEEILSTFGIDVLARGGGLRENGFVVLENDYAEIIAVRFEDLSKCTGEIGRFLGLDTFALPHHNASAKKAGSAAFKAAITSALDNPAGREFERELRESRYGRACGYDRWPEKRSQG